MTGLQKEIAMRKEREFQAELMKERREMMMKMEMQSMMQNATKKGKHDCGC